MAASNGSAGLNGELGPVWIEPGYNMEGDPFQDPVLSRVVSKQLPGRVQRSMRTGELHRMNVPVDEIGWFVLRPSGGEIGNGEAEYFPAPSGRAEAFQLC
jgi:hypothetical protein